MVSIPRERSISLEAYRRQLHQQPIALFTVPHAQAQVTAALQGLQAMTEQVTPVPLETEIPSLDEATHALADRLQDYPLWAWIRECSYPGWATVTALTLITLLPTTRIFVITTFPTFHLTEFNHR